MTSTSVTFSLAPATVTEVCTTRSTIAMLFEGKEAETSPFGSERGGDSTFEVTTLEVENGAKGARSMKERITYKSATMYGVRGGRRSGGDKTVSGRSYVLTRVDDDHFAATHLDGSAVSAAESDELSSRLDRSTPDLLAGRTMRVGQHVKLSHKEALLYFSSLSQAGLDVSGVELTLVAVKNGVAQVDMKFSFRLQGQQGDAKVTGWASTFTDADQRNVTTTVEGPLRVALADGGANLGPASNDKTATTSVLNGKFDMTDVTTCKRP